MLSSWILLDSPTKGKAALPGAAFPILGSGQFKDKVEFCVMQSVFGNPAKTSSSEPLPASLHAPYYRGFSLWFLTRHVIRLIAIRLLNIWCIWSGAARSLVWHIRIQSSREAPHVDLGPVYLQTPDGSLVESLGTRARAEGIRNLSAKYPWADVVHQQIFLMGFDAGEQIHVRLHHTETDKQSAVQS
jgi:hypothetical protein